MKNFILDVDFVMSKRIAVEAENEEQAKAIVNGWIKYNPYEYAHSFDAYVNHEITDVNEEKTITITKTKRIWKRRTTMLWT